jgi:transposase
MTIETVVQRSAGLDIAKASLVACIRTPAAGGGWQIRKRKFSTMTADLLTLAAWLAEHKVTRVGMESTSDYWRAVFYLLEADFECWLLNARHMRAVPGRKTDLLTELADRCFDRCVRRPAVLARFRPRDQRRGCAAGVVQAGGADARFA